MLKPVISDRSLVVSGLTIDGGIFLAQRLGVGILLDELLNLSGKPEPLATHAQIFEFSVEEFFYPWIPRHRSEKCQGFGMA